MRRLKLFLFVLIPQLLVQGEAPLSYDQAREQVLIAEEQLMTGGHTKLNPLEVKVNDIFMDYKLGELAKGFGNLEENTGALHFFKAKPLIDKSAVFHFHQNMPKGAVLHLHNSASVSSKWVIENISYMPRLLRCSRAKGQTVMSFRQMPTKHKCKSPYILVSDERKNSSDPLAYDQSLERLINLYTPVPEVEYSTLTSVWDRFQDMFDVFGDAITYLPAFRAYHKQMLQELYNDNVMYAEIRTSIKALYDDSGQIFPKDFTVREFYVLSEEFKKEHPDFLGIKLIFTGFRGNDVDYVKEVIEEFRKLHEAWPNFLVGFDLVGQEDKGKSLYDMLPALRTLPSTARLFLHGGETNWFGASMDINLLDALLLNTTRIGHAYALAKHPILMSGVKTRQIAVEVSPISNQVLHLVSDLRNHPGAEYLALDVPMVICNDDPGFWNAKGVSYDYYYAIMSLAPNYAGLRVLKTLVSNSVWYSSMTEEEKTQAFQILELSWSQFIDNVLMNGIL